jgi:hypothetical protein
MNAGKLVLIRSARPADDSHEAQKKPQAVVELLAAGVRFGVGVMSLFHGGFFHA